MAGVSATAASAVAPAKYPISSTANSNIPTCGDTGQVARLGAALTAAGTCTDPANQTKYKTVPFASVPGSWTPSVSAMTPSPLVTTMCNLDLTTFTSDTNADTVADTLNSGSACAGDGAVVAPTVPNATPMPDGSTCSIGLLALNCAAAYWPITAWEMVNGVAIPLDTIPGTGSGSRVVAAAICTGAGALTAPGGCTQKDGTNNPRRGESGGNNGVSGGACITTTACRGSFVNGPNGANLALLGVKDVYNPSAAPKASVSINSTSGQKAIAASAGTFGAGDVGATIKLLGAVNPLASVSRSANSSTITTASASTSDIGGLVTLTGFPANTRVVSAVNGVSETLSNAAATAATGLTGSVQRLSSFGKIAAVITTTSAVLAANAASTQVAAATRIFDLPTFFVGTAPVNVSPTGSAAGSIKVYEGSIIPGTADLIAGYGNGFGKTAGAGITSGSGAANALAGATVNVSSTAGFPSSGTFSIQSGTAGVNAVEFYTGKTGTSFTGVTTVAPLSPIPFTYTAGMIVAAATPNHCRPTAADLANNIDYCAFTILNFASLDLTTNIPSEFITIPLSWNASGSMTITNLSVAANAAPPSAALRIQGSGFNINDAVGIRLKDITTPTCFIPEFSANAHADGTFDTNDPNGDTTVGITFTNPGSLDFVSVPRLPACALSGDVISGTAYGVAQTNITAPYDIDQDLSGVLDGTRGGNPTSSNLGRVVTVPDFTLVA